MKNTDMCDGRQKYAVVGTGGRCRMFIDAILTDYAEHVRLVGFCDVSPTRMNYWNRHLEEAGHPVVPTFASTKFDDMVGQTKPDVVIVTSVDATHHQYIVRAMELGCDVITEKPMTIDECKVAEIFDAIEGTGCHLRVAFNYRWQPAFSLIQEVVASGRIGKPTLVDFQWRLDTSHGADYFRRWHRQKEHSGGLLVHKSTHHFDLVNWILGDHLDTLYAVGDLSFYGQANAAARGQTYVYDRYTDQPGAADDPFALNLQSAEAGEGKGELKDLYLDAEGDPGTQYIRDRNVFGGQDKWPITAEDTMALTGRYRKGTLFNYSLIAYCPWEGERLTITGTKGQIEYFGRGAGHIIAGQSEEDLTAAQQQDERYVRVQRMFESAEDLPIPEAAGGHGGGDRRLLQRIFLPESLPDPQGRDAGVVDGAWSVLTGVAANRSIETGDPVRLDKLAPAALLRL